MSATGGLAPQPGAAAYDVAALRAREFAWMDQRAPDGGRTIYLNAASTGPSPARAVAAVQAFVARRARPHTIELDDQFGTIARARTLAAGLIGAEPGEIATAVDTSYGLNLAARALPLAEGDVVVTSDREFPANVYPWMALERARGVRLRLVPARDGLPDEDALVAALDEPRVRVLALSWVSFATGARVDLDRLGHACRERGIFFVVDAIQGVGAAALDVRRTPVDVLACGAQKWLLSPWGTGFVYVRRELARTLDPIFVSWLGMEGSEDFTTLLDYRYRLHPDARRFELLTTGYQDFAGMVAALELLHELGPPAVAAHVARAAQRIVDWALPRDDVRLVTPTEPARRAGIVALAPRDAAAAARRLESAGVIHSVRDGMVRLAPHCYTTDDELDAALAALGG